MSKQLRAIMNSIRLRLTNPEMFLGLMKDVNHQYGWVKTHGEGTPSRRAFSTMLANKCREYEREHPFDADLRVLMSLGGKFLNARRSALRRALSLKSGGVQLTMFNEEV